MSEVSRAERERWLLAYIALGSLGTVAFWWNYSVYSGITVHAVLAWLFWVCTNALILLWLVRYSPHHRLLSPLLPIVLMWLSLLTGWAVYMAVSVDGDVADMGSLALCLGAFCVPTLIVVAVGFYRRWQRARTLSD